MGVVRSTFGDGPSLHSGCHLVCGSAVNLIAAVHRLHDGLKGLLGHEFPHDPFVKNIGTEILRHPHERLGEHGGFVGECGL